MVKSVQAIYENGVFRPLEPFNLPEKELVTVTIPEAGQAKNAAPSVLEILPLSDDDFDHLLDELARGPTLPHLPTNFSRADIYVDHD